MKAGRYTLVEQLGKGGFGEVWVGEADDGTRVAVKVLEVRTGWAARRFAREVEVLLRLDHPGCVRLIEHGFLESQQPFLVMDLVDGETLDTWMDQRPSLARCVEIAAQIADAANYAHSQQILHRDLKPSNVMLVDPDLERPIVKLVDFGIAKLSGLELSDVTKTGEMLGTPGYMSPEQLRASDQIGPASDVYALGVILFEMIEGRPPFMANSPLQIAFMHLQDTTPLVSPAVSSDVRKLVSDMLEKDPADRPTMREVSDVLRGKVYQPTPRRGNPERSTETAAQVERSLPRIPIALGLIAALVASAVVVAAWYPAVEEAPVSRRPPALLSGITRALNRNRRVQSRVTSCFLTLVMIPVTCKPRATSLARRGVGWAGPLVITSSSGELTTVRHG